MTSNFLFEIHSRDVLTDYDENEPFACFESGPVCLNPYRQPGHLQLATEREITPAPEIPALPFLRVTLNKQPKDPSLGWVCGSSETASDIVIGKLEQSVSRRQFSISLAEEAGSVVLTNRSRNGTFIQQVVGGKVITTLIQHQQEHEISRGQQLKVLFAFHDLELVTSEVRGRYSKSRWAAMYAAQQKALPSLDSIMLAPVAPSTHIEKYLLQEAIMQHEEYAIHKALVRHSGNQVLIKRYKPNRDQKAAQEAKLLSQVKHAHIITFYEHDPPRDLVFAFFEGKTLDAEHASVPLKFSEFKMIIAQLLDATTFLHGLGLCHRAIGPSGIAISKRYPLTQAILLNFDFDSSIEGPSRDAAMCKDMLDLLQLCILYVGGGRPAIYIESRISNVSSASWRKLLSTVLRYVTARDVQPSKLAESLARDDNFVAELLPQSDDDEELPPQGKMYEPASPNDDESTLPDTELPEGWEAGTEVADADDGALPVNWEDVEEVPRDDGASTLRGTSPVNWEDREAVLPDDCASTVLDTSQVDWANDEMVFPDHSEPKLSANAGREVRPEMVILKHGPHSISVKKDAHQYRVHVRELLRATRHKVTHQLRGAKRRSPRLRVDDARVEQQEYWVSKERAASIAISFGLHDLSKKICKLK